MKCSLRTWILVSKHAAEAGVLAGLDAEYSLRLLEHRAAVMRFVVGLLDGLLVKIRRFVGFPSSEFASAFVASAHVNSSSATV